jgi:branched-chain amino acid transport system ATP-binding protein
MLKIKNLTTGYGNFSVVHDVNIDVNAGEIVTLIGANGSGKTTLVKAISGLLPAPPGSILLEDVSIDHLTPRERVLSGIVQVPEGRQIFPGLTVSDNLLLGAYVHSRELPKADMLARMKETCATFPILLERMHMPAGNLSGGQQQMLAIARGLMSLPRLLILDEPSLGLSPALVMDIFRLILGLREKGYSILLSEQNAKLSLAVADRGYVIENGRIVLQGSGQELLSRPDVAAMYLGGGKGEKPAMRDADMAISEKLTKLLS